MSLRQAAEQALEALQDVVKLYASRDANENLMPCHNQNPEIKLSMEAEEALRQALEEPEQEPVCFLRETSWSYEIAPWDDPNGIPVYIAPPKKEWVGLTRRELDIATLGLEDLGDCYTAIEAKLKEKNG